ncbi:MAG: sulfatase-like hydrolase/transferase, partial [Phycisphaerae bacterium]
DRRPNILFVQTDYQRGVDGPSLGSGFLKMPTLDRLCKEGAVFARHISTSPISMPARFCWVTGQYPHTHGEWDNYGRTWPEKSPMLVELLRGLGYHTVGVGKMHFFPWDRMTGFDRRIIAEGQGNSAHDDYDKFLNAHGLSRRDLHRIKGRFGVAGANAVYDWPHDESLHIDSYVGEQARLIIQRRELKAPWFLWVSFPGPHNPWNPPARYARPYLEMADLPLGSTFPGELRTKPIDYTRHRYCYGKPAFDVIDSRPEDGNEIFRAIRAGHYGNLTMIDEQVGGILKALEAAGDLDNTLVIWSSDHGSALGNHNMLHKGTHFDTDARVPFVVRHPGMVKPGVRKGFSAHVDLLATLVSLAGGRVPKEVEGKDLTGMLTDPDATVADFAVMECTLVTSIITDRWKMAFHHFNSEADLYDLRNDPKELKNLAGRAEYAAIEKALAEKLVKWRRGLDPRADVPDDPYRWRECLGPVVDVWRKMYMAQYTRMAKLEGRPGKTGRKYFDRYFGKA